jgi:uncharacterized membrane protein
LSSASAVATIATIQDVPVPTVARRTSRIPALDVARALACLAMLQGHTVDALLGPAYRVTSGFQLWTLVRGLTPSMFLFLSGCAFSVATFGRRDTRPGRWPHRLRRCGVLLALGYAMHYPTANLRDLLGFSGTAWHPLLAVDILQCIAVTLIVLEAIATATSGRRAFIAVSAASAAAVALLAPLAWAFHWDASLPAFFEGFLSPRIGSQFPLLPWFAYSALGAAVGATLGHRGTDTTIDWLRLIPIGLALVAVGLLARAAHLDPWAVGPHSAASPSRFLWQGGAVCMIVALIGLAMRSRVRPIGIVDAVAKESLTVYAVHICLVYGSPWNRGLRQQFGPTLPLATTILWVLVLWTAMGALALAWSRFKASAPVPARHVRWLTAAGLSLGLIF